MKSMKKHLALLALCLLGSSVLWAQDSVVPPAKNSAAAELSDCAGTVAELNQEIGRLRAENTQLMAIVESQQKQLTDTVAALGKALAESDDLAWIKRGYAPFIINP